MKTQGEKVKLEVISEAKPLHGFHFNMHNAAHNFISPLNFPWLTNQLDQWGIKAQINQQ